MNMVFTLGNRIDSANAAEFEKEVMELANENTLELDANALEYISSAGLRVILKLRKKYGNLIITNVGRDVYDILENTGFIEFLEIRKKTPFVSLDKAECIGSGVTATVYKIDEDTIVKVFAGNIPDAVAYSERDKAKQAFLSGISTAIPFDVVRTENGLGVVYEKLNADTLLNLIISQPEKRLEYLKQFAAFIRDMHKVNVDVEKYCSVSQPSINTIPELTKAGIITNEEEERLEEFFRSIPEKTTFIHGDCHIGNVMLSGDELFFIDMSDCGYGHPIFDLLSMNTAYYLSPHNGIPVFPAQLGANFTAEECLEMWYTFLGEYFQSEDKNFLEDVSLQMEALAAARMLCVTLKYKGLFTEPFVEMLKNIFNTYYLEKRKPILF